MYHGRGILLSFNEVLQMSREWLLSARSAQNGNMSFAVLTDNGEALRVILETPLHMAELVVTADAGFAPYRFVSFFVYSTDIHSPDEPLFCFFDSDETTADELLRGLNEGMRLMTGSFTG